MFLPPRYQGSNVVAGEMLTRRRLPGNSADAIETQQSGLRRQPEVTVRGLSNFVDRARGKTLADCPRCVCVLADIERGI